MRIATFGIAVLGLGLVAAGAILFVRQPTAEPDQPDLATPPGVTLSDVKVGAAVASTGYVNALTKPAFANAKNMTLYTFDKDVEPGKSACAGNCATERPPAAVPAGALAFGDWSIIRRGDGASQWAYKGKPLYGYAQDAKIGDIKGASEAWHVAFLAPEDGIAMPDGVSMQDMSNAGGVVYVGSDGKPLYMFHGDGKNKPTCVKEPCSSHWTPFAAAQLARPVGDFTVVSRDDGILQWAYRGRPLYTYNGDTILGDAKGDGVDGNWHVVRRMRQFMPQGVKIRHNHYDGDNLATDAGMTLYVRDRVFGSTIGHSMRDGFANEPDIGRILGTAACDADCTKTWRPLAAPADASPSGYWDVAIREDGTKQWVYRGFALYTFTGDGKPGDMAGNDTYEIMAENDPFTAADTKVRGTGAMEWHVAIP